MYPKKAKHNDNKTHQTFILTISSQSVVKSTSLNTRYTSPIATAVKKLYFSMEIRDVFKLNQFI